CSAVVAKKDAGPPGGCRWRRSSRYAARNALRCARIKELTSISGIYAASILKNEYRVPVVVVEAAPYMGGRTKAANFIHGEKSFLADLARKLDLTHFDAFSVFVVRYFISI